jgi:sugar phosphate isomerase/epimerase
MRTASLAAALLLLGAHAERARAAEAQGEGWTLGCRLACYGKFQEAGWKHLPSIGVRTVFLSVPKPEDVAAVQERLRANGLRVMVMRGEASLAQPSSVDELAAQLATCEKMGVRYMFLSPKHPGASKEVAIERLRRVGDAAKKHGVTVVLETHPDLGTNAAVHLETMRQVDHPSVRVNFDTGNITYYHQHTAAVSELKKIMDYVATVELKDHSGEPMGWAFPALGQGKVDFAGILAVLKERGFAGPITIEVEGVRGKPWDEAQTKQAIAESVAFLRKLGQFQ